MHKTGRDRRRTRALCHDRFAKPNDRTWILPLRNERQRFESLLKSRHDSGIGRLLSTQIVPRFLRHFELLLIVLLLVTCVIPVVFGQSPSNRGLQRIPAGTVVDDDDASRWNRIVLLARPRIASGAQSALSKSIRDTVSTFVLTVLATVEREIAADGQTRYALAEVGLGYSMKLNDQWTVVSSVEQKRLGAGLGFFQRQLLGSNEKQLDTATLIVSTPTMLIFDTPSIMLRDGQHRDFITRHCVWLDSKSGKCSALLWLLSKTPPNAASKNAMTVADEAMRWIPEGMREERRIHVDGDEFFLGVPSERAFALEDLPDGKPIPWTDRAKQVAALPSYNAESLRELAASLNQAFQALTTTPRPPQ